MKHPFLTTRTGSRNFYFRRKFPLELRPVLQRAEIWMSLDTASRDLAAARLKKASGRYDELIASARATMPAVTLPRSADEDNWQPPGATGNKGTEPATYHPFIRPTGWTTLAEIHIPRLVERYRAHALESERDNRLALFAELEDAPECEANQRSKRAIDQAGYDEEAHRCLLTEARKQVRRARAAEDLSVVREAAEELLAWERVWLPANSEGFKQFLTQLADAELNILDEELRRLDGEVGPSPELMPLLDVNDTWEAALKLWEADATPQPKTVSEVKTQVARFKTVVGALPLSSLTSAHVAQFKTALLEKEALSKSRINTIFSLLSPVINVAMDEKFTPLAANPFSGAKFKKKAVLKDTEVARDAFTIDELDQLYASSVFRQNARPGKGAGEAAYWLPLLGPHTGARLEDLCRLHAGDVVQRDGVWCLHLHDTKREHRTGLANVMRHVPIHKTLLSLGWLDYVSTQGKHTLLFPRLKPNQYGQLSATWSTWFNEYLDVSVGLDDPRLDYHSFRHTFKAFGQLSGINDFAIEALMGHAPDSQYGRTEQGEKRLPFELLVQAMEKLSFPGLSLGHLQAREHTL